MPIKAKRVAVIGAGPSGAIATDALVKEQAFQTIRVFERRPVIGGSWVYTPHLPAQIPSLRDVLDGNADWAIQVPSQLPAETPKSEAVNSHQARYSDTAQHEHLHSNIDPFLMSYLNYPFPEDISQDIREKYGPEAPFRDREVIRQWVEDIFVRNGLEELLELNTTVEHAEKKNGEWILTLRKDGPGKNQWWQESFDALVVASGHYNIPWIPQIPGLLEYDAKFQGRVTHSKHFRDAKKFRGKRVVVVGGSVSCAEIIHEILPFAQHPVIASLRGPPLPAFGWVPWTHPHIVVKKQITKFDPSTGRIFLADGSHLDDVDHVIFGTGYTFSLPYLPTVQEKVKNAYRRLPDVYQHTWYIDDPSLAFVGMLGGGFTFRIYQWQAVAIARQLSGRGKTLPPIKEQKEWEKRRAEALRGGKAYYSIAPNYEEFFEFLRGIAGEPVEGTTGVRLPPFDKSWLQIWAGMVAPKIEFWERARKRAEEAAGTATAKL
ncbi:thiol-specific monooxygenase [Rhizodiscina lignyota]|uniref:Thiol-specific monooxygenase n=1 Tax=Rhizodiscina lignyota TaxID=1504668 RepID=A0A9P4I9S9_9PEZI|nr:thiol-specific monooxygenase [Rhizodiscina lignyota]